MIRDSSHCRSLEIDVYPTSASVTDRVTAPVKFSLGYENTPINPDNQYRIESIERFTCFLETCLNEREIPYKMLCEVMHEVVKHYEVWVMGSTELDNHLTEQDRLDELEKNRLIPIYANQRDTLVKFQDWLNEMHPDSFPFEMKPKREYIDMKPYIEGPKSIIEFEGESTDEISFDLAIDEDAYKILWELYQKR